MLVYGGQVAVAIQRFKYQDKPYLARPLGLALSTAMTPELASLDLVVPVPLHSRRLRHRGYNQALLLARTALKAGPGPRPPLACDALHRIRDTVPQVTLAAGGSLRMANVNGAFEATKAVQGKRVLLVDDVTTSGATANACAAALLEHGALQVHLLTLACTVR